MRMARLASRGLAHRGIAALLLGAAGTITACSVVSLPRTDPRASPPAKVLTTAEVAELGRRATVRVELAQLRFPLPGQSRQQVSSGSGIALGQDLVLTAAHVVASDADSDVLTRSAGTTSVSYAGRVVGPATILLFERQYDLAILHVAGLDAAGALALTWGNPSGLQAGNRLVVVGYPGTVGLSVSSGIVSGLKRIATTELIQTDAAMNSGNSGGPVLDERGQLVGYADFNYPGYVGLNFAVSAATARPVVEELVAQRGLGEALRLREELVARMTALLAQRERASPDSYNDVSELSEKAATIVARSTVTPKKVWYRDELAALDRLYASIMRERATWLSIERTTASLGQPLSASIVRDENARHADKERRFREQFAELVRKNQAEGP